MGNRKKVLIDVIQNEVFITKDEANIVSSGGTEMPWFFDFKNILLQPNYLDLIAEIFWDEYEHNYPFQVSGLDVAAIPLIAAIVIKSIERGKPVSGFFIRKSRKGAGLLKIVEGKVTEEKIILVDDLINSGKSVTKQLAVLSRLGKRVFEVFTILRFRDVHYYKFLEEQNVRLNALFPITQFGLPYIENESKKFLGDVFNVEWYFKSQNPNYFYVVPKSTPVLDKEKIYFGSDSGYFLGSRPKRWRCRVET